MAELEAARKHATPLNWSRFNRITRKYVPSCRVLHPYPEERFFASRPFRCFGGYHVCLGKSGRQENKDLLPAPRPSAGNNGAPFHSPDRALAIRLEGQKREGLTRRPSR
jgi:hypothetical protein